MNQKIKDIGIGLSIASIFLIWYLWLKFFIEDFVNNYVPSNFPLIGVFILIYLPMLIAIFVLIILNRLLKKSNKNPVVR